MMHEAHQPHVVPADRLYWALLDPRQAGIDARRPNTRDTHRRLSYLFEEYLPVTAESVHCVFAGLDEGRVLGCAIEREDLVAIRDGEAEAVLPSEVPVSSLGSNAPDLKDLNLLHGEFRSLPATQRRARAQRVVAAGAALVGIIGFIGLERRTAAYVDRSASTQTAIQQVYNEVLPTSQNDRRPPSLRLTQELRLLRQAEVRTGQSTPDAATGRAASDLAEVLEGWPEHAEVRTEQIDVRHDLIEIRGETADSATWLELRTRMQELPNWREFTSNDRPSARGTDARSFRIVLKPQDRPAAPGARP